MLINLSNHPSTRWSEEQRQKAIDQYGSIQDMAFPQIKPEASSDEVRQLAEKYYLQIRKAAAEQSVNVHLMGEMTFTYTLVNQLREAGIPCIASTTHRTVEEKDGKKIVQFKFIQFRSYF